MKSKLLLLVGLAAVFALSGCDKDKVADYAFDRTTVQSGVVQADSIQLPDGTLAVVTPEMRSLVDPAKIIPAGTPISEEKVAPKAMVVTAVNAVKYLPIPGADILSYALNGLLGIAAVWLTKKKKTADKVSASLVKGVDTFRDILDQTEGGAKLDDHLTTALKQQQQTADVITAIKSLLDRYATPAKPPASQLTAAALKS
jgi:hypothetical protein